MTSEISTTPGTSGETASQDFDFLAGTWDVANRRRLDFLGEGDSAADWERFPGVGRASRHFDGRASFDEIEFPTLGLAGLTLRLYDPQREAWSLYWASQRTGLLFPPVVGRFADGVGEFYGDDTYHDAKVRVRFVWSEITADSAHWQQAFSADGGEHWVTNWHMWMTRRAD